MYMCTNKYIYIYIYIYTYVYSYNKTIKNNQRIYNKTDTTQNNNDTAN